jgi:hypothetical protein
VPSRVVAVGLAGDSDEPRIQVLTLAAATGSE